MRTHLCAVSAVGQTSILCRLSLYRNYAFERRYGQNGGYRCDSFPDYHGWLIDFLFVWRQLYVFSFLECFFDDVFYCLNLI